MTNTKWAETKYLIIMRLAERWAMEALQQDIQPADYCWAKFRLHSSCHGWSEVTKTILTAFVIREYCVYRQFLHD